jgi:hypothetical protein
MVAADRKVVFPPGFTQLVYQGHGWVALKNTFWQKGQTGFREEYGNKPTVTKGRRLPRRGRRGNSLGR